MVGWASWKLDGVRFHESEQDCRKASFPRRWQRERKVMFCRKHDRLNLWSCAGLRILARIFPGWQTITEQMQTRKLFMLPTLQSNLLAIASKTPQNVAQVSRPNGSWNFKSPRSPDKFTESNPRLALQILLAWLYSYCMTEVDDTYSPRSVVLAP